MTLSHQSTSCIYIKLSKVTIHRVNIYSNTMESFLFHYDKGMKAIYGGKNNMAKCPKCSTEVAKPKKTWKMAGRPDKAGKRMQLEIGLYECPKCGNVFREVLSKKKI
jgi:uncharacterized protein with PIN domain